MFYSLTWPRIKNPLIGLSKAKLLQDVSEFATRFGLEHIQDELVKGALVAQNPLGYRTIHELDDEDRLVLEEEVIHKWRHPRLLYLTIVLNSVAAAIQGWDQTGRIFSTSSTLLY